MTTHLCLSLLYSTDDLYSYSYLNFLFNYLESKGDVPGSRTWMKHSGLIKEPFRFGWQRDSRNQVCSYRISPFLIVDWEIFWIGHVRARSPMAIIWELLTEVIWSWKQLHYSWEWYNFISLSFVDLSTWHSCSNASVIFPLPSSHLPALSLWLPQPQLSSPPPPPFWSSSFFSSPSSVQSPTSSWSLLLVSCSWLIIPHGNIFCVDVKDLLLLLMKF